MRYVFHMKCPRCQKTAEHANTRKIAPHLSCGDCLMDHLEVVHFEIVRVEEIAEDSHGV